MAKKKAVKKGAAKKTAKNAHAPVGIFVEGNRIFALIKRGKNFYKAYEQADGSFTSEDKPIASKATLAGAKKTKQGALHIWREDKKYALGLVSRNGAAYAALREGRAWHYGKESAIKARGEDFDPNRPRMFFDHHGVEVLGIFDIKEGALVIYQSAVASVKKYSVALGAALFEVDGLTWKERWRTELSICEEELPLAEGEIVEPLGAVRVGDMIRVFWGSSTGGIYTFSFPQPFTNLVSEENGALSLHRFEGNPIVVPNPASDWEAVATFNPAAILVDGKVHLFYRAIGRDGRSVWGHAVSSDGLHFTRWEQPVYVPGTEGEGIGIARKKKKAINLRCPVSGVDGAEDPRATVIDGDVHVLYAAFNGWAQTRAAHITAPLEGLMENALDWSRPTLLSAPPTHWGTGAKNAALLPKKVGDSYVVFHRIWPDICIDYTPSLDFEEFRDDPDRWLEPKGRIKVRPAHWDSGKILVGAPPLETPEGWLLIYNAVSHQHDGGGYKIGAMILDRNNPEKVLYRCRRPLISSKAWYEASGLTPRVTYACGAVIKDGTLFVYYGGADTYVNVATAPLEQFLTALKHDPVEQREFANVKITSPEHARV